MSRMPQPGSTQASTGRRPVGPALAPPRPRPAPGRHGATGHSNLTRPRPGHGAGHESQDADAACSRPSRPTPRSSCRAARSDPRPAPRASPRSPQPLPPAGSTRPISTKCPMLDSGLDKRRRRPKRRHGSSRDDTSVAAQVDESGNRDVSHTASHRRYRLIRHPGRRLGDVAPAAAKGQPAAGPAGPAVAGGEPWPETSISVTFSAKMLHRGRKGSHAGGPPRPVRCLCAIKAYFLRVRAASDHVP